MLGTLASPLPTSSAQLSGHQVFITRGAAARKKCPFHGDQKPQNQDPRRTDTSQPRSCDKAFLFLGGYLHDADIQSGP